MNGPAPFFSPSHRTANRVVAPAGAARQGARVLDVFVDALDWDEALRRIWRWARLPQSRMVCCSNVHSVVTAGSDARFRAVLAAADLVTPDGMPVAWMLRRLGYPQQARIDGPGLMWRLCALAARSGLPVYLYGNTPDTLERLRTRLLATHPRLVLVGMHAPPFGPQDAAMEAADVARINRSGARLVFVSLGCPKQELWMAHHRDRLRTVLVGVGAAFDYHAGTLARAPRWMQAGGLEWVHRLGSEPARLWRRYAASNSVFMARALAQCVRTRRAEAARAQVVPGIEDAFIE